MTIRTITLARTIQVRQYEPLALTLSADLADGEDAADAYRELIERMRSFFWHATDHMRAEFAPKQEKLTDPF